MWITLKPYLSIHLIQTLPNTKLSRTEEIQKQENTKRGSIYKLLHKAISVDFSWATTHIPSRGPQTHLHDNIHGIRVLPPLEFIFPNCLRNQQPA